jgi:hypothetical protein
MSSENNFLEPVSEDSVKKAMELFKKNLTNLGVSAVVAETATKKEGNYSVDIKSQTIVSNERRERKSLDDKQKDDRDRATEGKIAISFKPKDSKKGSEKTK